VRFQHKPNKTTLPEPMLFAYGLTTEEESCLDDIKLSNLIFTRTGYALDMEIIIAKYKTERTLINPYTNAEFCESELKDICDHPDGEELALLITRNIKACVTERTINMLVEYLNAAVFDKGFSTDYDDLENKKAFNAWIKLTYDMTYTLPKHEREAFLNETIPNESDRKTIAYVFDDSVTKCLTGNSVLLAKVVLAYKGRQDCGLHSKDLISRAYCDGVIERREFETQAELTSGETTIICLYDNNEVAKSWRPK
jgi:hypothetical protein